jgi:hypothetical protein
LYDSTGPNAAVSGHMTMTTVGVGVDHARLMPPGAMIWFEYSGFSPCDIAYGNQRMDQM